MPVTSIDFAARAKADLDRLYSHYSVGVTDGKVIVSRYERLANGALGDEAWETFVLTLVRSRSGKWSGSYTGTLTGIGGYQAPVSGTFETDRTGWVTSHSCIRNGEVQSYSWASYGDLDSRLSHALTAARRQHRARIVQLP